MKEQDANTIAKRVADEATETKKVIYPDFDMGYNKSPKGWVDVYI